MQYTRSNFKSAAPVADKKDIDALVKYGVEFLAKRANNGDIACQARLQRLVNSGLLAEGKY